MTDSLFRAIIVRCILAGLCGFLLGGVAIHAEVTRPGPPADQSFYMMFEEPPN